MSSTMVEQTDTCLKINWKELFHVDIHYQDIFIHGYKNIIFDSLHTFHVNQTISGISGLQEEPELIMHREIIYSECNFNTNHITLLLSTLVPTNLFSECYQ
jgi:hypothetical protein